MACSDLQNNCIIFSFSNLDFYSVSPFFSSVPRFQNPVRMHAQLCMIDNFEKFGICRHFRNEIKSILDQTYRWYSKIKIFMYLIILMD